MGTSEPYADIIKKVTQRFLAASNFWESLPDIKAQEQIIEDWVGELLPMDIGPKEYWNEVAEEIAEGVWYNIACYQAGEQMGYPDDAVAQFMGLLYQAQYGVSGSVLLSSAVDDDIVPF